MFDPVPAAAPYKQGDNRDMPPNPMSDEQLMQDYASGSVTAFEQLYARHEGALFRFVRRVLGQLLASQADEAFQDCWLRIVNARGSFNPDAGSWKTWAFTIAHNLCLDRLRSSGRELSMDAIENPMTSDATDADPPAWVQQALTSNQPGPEDQSHWRAAGKQLLLCLEALPAAQRAAFLLHYEEDKSVEELAQALSLSFETAKSRLRYALQKLRGCMQAYLQAGEPA
jgi:RNA polymerase sigma factor (sigma-70 family)